MNTILNVEPEVFALLLLPEPVLAVEGEFSEDLRTRTRQLMQAKGVPQGTEWTGLSPVTDAPLNPPADLLALVGKACETCKGDGSVTELVGLPPNGVIMDCPDCQGTGSELLAVTMECETCHGSGCDIDYCTACGDEYSEPCDRHEDHPAWELGCEDEPCCPDCHGTRSLLVRLTGQPVLVIVPTDPNFDRDDEIVVSHGVPWHKGQRIDLGPDPASLIGRWVWLPDALEVVE